MRSGSIIHHVFTFLERPNGPSKKGCLFVALLLVLITLARHWLDANGETEAASDGHLATTRGVVGRLPEKVLHNRTLLPTASLLSLAGDSSDTDKDSAVGEGEDCEPAEGSDPEPPTEVSCLASELSRSLRLDDEGDGGFVEPSLCPGQLGLMTLGGEYKPMAVAYAECSSGLSWCRQAEQCLPMLRDSVVLRRESWPFLPAEGASPLGAVRSPTQTWNSVRVKIPHSCFCGRRHHQPEDAQLQAAVARDV
ncbi:uncharacterized protein LOC126184102 [Schistocerca cancellata]|uniref:uncharacterized protein LOC126184102 n=1 Tax=Schistocerca cancellata TaxID=274614 RepID=UPI00211758DC|nr:uncharacterized protein LOC126184102 [Schistocerca cancellata]